MVDSIPVLGHVKGVVHLIKGDTDQFWKSEEAATRTLVVLGAGALTVSTGGAAAPILAGVVAGLVYDAVTTGVESARHGKFDPQGYIDAGAEIKDDWRAGAFDLVAIGAMDGFLGKGKTGRATKIYRIEGESYWKNNHGEYTWNSNNRLYRDGDGIMVSRKPGGAGGFDAVETIPSDEDGEYIQLDQTLPKRGADLLFLNTDHGARADAFYAKRVLQYQDAVAKMGRRPSHVTHNIKVKTFRIMTRDAERLQNRSIPEAGAKTNIDYDGVLRVDPTKARGQYGCERRVYVPLIRRALKGSYKEFTPWIDHLPIPILRLIRDHPITYGRVRSIFIHTANPAFLATSLARDAPANLQPDPNQGSDAGSTLASHHIPLSYLSEEGIRSVHAQDIPVVGLRLARHAKCSRQNKTETYHGDHFEYLAEHADGTTHWYPSFLVADDLIDEFEGLTMANGKEVVEVVSSDPSTGNLTVSRLDGSTDTVKQTDLFWVEDDPEDSVPLQDDELDTILHHGHYGRDHTSCHAVFSFQSNWAKVEVTSPGVTFSKDPSMPDNVYDNVTFETTSVYFTTPGGDFRRGALPFLIFNQGIPIDLTITHGTDGKQSGDALGWARADFHGKIYLNLRNDNYNSGQNPMDFTSCPTRRFPAEIGVKEIDDLFQHGHYRCEPTVDSGTYYIFAVFSLLSDWAQIDITNGSLAQASGYPDEIYNNVTWYSNADAPAKYLAVRYKPNGGAFPQGISAIPFVVVSTTGDPVDITITHGRDGKWQGDNQGYRPVLILME